MSSAENFETVLVRDESGCLVVPATKLSDLDLAQNMGCTIDAALDGAGVFKRINEFLMLQFVSLQCNRRIDKQAQIVGVSRDVWAKLQERYPCNDASVRISSAEMIMRANPQLTKLHVVDFDREATDFEQSINCIVYRTGHLDDGQKSGFHIKQDEENYAGYLVAYAKICGGYDVPARESMQVAPVCAAIAADDARRGDGPRTAADLRAKIVAMTSDVSDATA